MNKTLTWMLAAVAAFGLVAGLQAQGRGNREEAQSMCDAAYKHIEKVGAKQAYKDFTTDKLNWTKKDLYVMVYDGNGVVVAHGANVKLVGRDMLNTKDANGVPIVIGLLALAAKGGGWFNYDWPDPITKTILAKSTYARSQPSGEGFIGVGIYK